MTNFHTINDSRDYMNYFFNIGSRGVTETTAEIMGMSNTIRNALGNLAFKTSEYLGQAESVATGFGLTTIAAFTSATKSAMEFQQAVASVEAISGKQLSGGAIGEKAMAMSNKFGLATTEMTQGLEALARAGITANESINALLESGVQMTKFEGRDLEESINDILATTNLLNPDINPDTDEFAQTVRDLNQTIISTSESSPINAKNIIDTLQHVGGYAAATSLDQEDLFATIAQLGAKGTKGEIAGTSLRAFISAGQKDTAQRALDRIGLKVTDLWSESGENILPLSEMKRVLDEALDAKGFSKQEKIEFYSDFVGYKQANQVMKIDPEGIDEYKNKINNAMSLTDKMNIILGTVKGNWSQISQIATNFMTRVGNKFLPILNMILVPTKYLLKLVTSIPFLDWGVAIGGSIAAVSGLSVLFNNLVPTIFTFVNKFIDFQEMFNNKQKSPLQIVFENIKNNLIESREILGDIVHLRVGNLEQMVNDKEAEKLNKRLRKETELEVKSEFFRQFYGYAGWGARIDEETNSGTVYDANEDVIAHVENGKFTIAKDLKRINESGEFELVTSVGDKYDEDSFVAKMDEVFGEGMQNQKISIWDKMMGDTERKIVMNKFRPPEGVIDEMVYNKILFSDAMFTKAYKFSEDRWGQGFPFRFSAPSHISFRPIENLQSFNIETIQESIEQIKNDVQEFYSIFKNDYKNRTFERERNSRTNRDEGFSSLGRDTTSSATSSNTTSYDGTVLPTMNNALQRIEDLLQNGQIIADKNKEGRLGYSNEGQITISPNSILREIKIDSHFGEDFGTAVLENTIHEMLHTLMQQKYRESQAYKGDLSINNFSTKEKHGGYNSHFVAEAEANYGTVLLLSKLGLKPSENIISRLSSHTELLINRGLDNEMQLDLVESTVNALAEKTQDISKIMSGMASALDLRDVDVATMKSLQNTINVLNNFNPNVSRELELKEKAIKLVGEMFEDLLLQDPKEHIKQREKLTDVVLSQPKNAVNDPELGAYHLYLEQSRKMGDYRTREGPPGVQRLGKIAQDYVEMFDNIASFLKKHYIDFEAVTYNGGKRPLHTLEDGIGAFTSHKSTSIWQGKANQFGPYHNRFFVPTGINGVYTNKVLEQEITLQAGQLFLELYREGMEAHYLLLTREIVDLLGISQKTIKNVADKKNLEILLRRAFNVYDLQSDIDMDANTLNDNTNLFDVINTVGNIDNFMKTDWTKLKKLSNGYVLTDKDIRALRNAQIALQTDRSTSEDLKIGNVSNIDFDGFESKGREDKPDKNPDGSWNSEKFTILRHPGAANKRTATLKEIEEEKKKNQNQKDNSKRNSHIYLLREFPEYINARLDDAIAEYHAYATLKDTKKKSKKAEFGFNQFFNHIMGGYNKSRFTSSIIEMLKRKDSTTLQTGFTKSMSEMIKNDENAPPILQEFFKGMVDNEQLVEKYRAIEDKNEKDADEILNLLTRYLYDNSEEIYKRKIDSYTKTHFVMTQMELFFPLLKHNDYKKADDSPYYWMTKKFSAKDFGLNDEIIHNIIKGSKYYGEYEPNLKRINSENIMTILSGYQKKRRGAKPEDIDLNRLLGITDQRAILFYGIEYMRKAAEDAEKKAIKAGKKPEDYEEYQNYKRFKELYMKNMPDVGLVLGNYYRDWLVHEIQELSGKEVRFGTSSEFKENIEFFKIIEEAKNKMQKEEASKIQDAHIEALYREFNGNINKFINGIITKDIDRIGENSVSVLNTLQENVKKLHDKVKTVVTKNTKQEEKIEAVKIMEMHPNNDSQNNEQKRKQQEEENRQAQIKNIVNMWNEFHENMKIWAETTSNVQELQNALNNIEGAKPGFVDQLKQYNSEITKDMEKVAEETKKMIEDRIKTIQDNEEKEEQKRKLYKGKIKITKKNHRQRNTAKSLIIKTNDDDSDSEDDTKSEENTLKAKDDRVKTKKQKQKKKEDDKKDDDRRGPLDKFINPSRDKHEDSKKSNKPKSTKCDICDMLMKIHELLKEHFEEIQEHYSTMAMTITTGLPYMAQTLDDIKYLLEAIKEILNNTFNVAHLIGTIIFNAANNQEEVVSEPFIDSDSVIHGASTAEDMAGNTSGVPLLEGKNVLLLTGETHIESDDTTEFGEPIMGGTIPLGGNVLGGFLEPGENPVIGLLGPATTDFTFPEGEDPKVKPDSKFKNRLEAFKEYVINIFNKIQEKIGKIFNKATKPGVDRYASSMRTLSKTIESVSDRLDVWKGGLQDLADVFPMLQVPVAGLTAIINKVEKVKKATNLVDTFMNKNDKDIVSDLFGATFAGTKYGKAVEKQLLPVIKTAIKAGIGYFVAGAEIVIGILMNPITLAIAAGTAVIAGTAKIMQKMHDDNLEKLKKQQEENENAYKSAKISYESAKTELDKPYLTPEERERAEIRYDTRKAELEYANMKKQTGAMDVQKSKDSYLWGEYGLRASTQKILRGHLVGEFESQAANYEGTSKNIREIKESTLASLDSEAQHKVAQYYDANSHTFAVMDAYKSDLEELYDYETKLIKMYGSLDAARASSFYQNKLAEKSETTGISKENLKQYLDWMQTEHNVDVAKSTMKGRANQIVAETEMKALAVANGADLADAMGLNGIEEQQRAMVKAQADMIKQEAADTLWWKAFWSGLSAMFWKIVSPITFIANLLTYMWKVISSLDIIIYDAVTLGKGPMSSGDKARLEEVREARGDVANSVADFFMNGREAKKARTYYQGYKQIEKENLEELGNRSISETDRASYGNDTSMNTHAYGAEASIVPQPTYDTFKKEGQGAAQGFRDGLNQHSPGDIANAINDEFGFMQDFISKFSISDVFHGVGKKATKGFKNGLNQHSPGDISQSVGDIGVGISGQPIRGYRQGYGTIIGNILVHTRKISKNTNDISKGINPNMTEWYKQGHSGEDGSLSRRIKNSLLYNQGIGLPEGVDPDDPEVKAEQRKRQAQTLAKTGGNVLGGWGLSRDGTPKGFKPFKIIRWAYQQITGQALEDTISQVYKSIMGEGAETAAKSAGKSGAKKIAIEGGDEAAEKIAINVGKKAAREGAETAAKKVGKEGAESAAKSVVKKAGINALKGAVPLIGPLITAGISAYEHNPFETHYNEDGTEKRALQSTGEFTGEVLGSVGAEIVQTLAAGNPLVGAAASMILEPLGEAVGGTIGWYADEGLNSILGLFGLGSNAKDNEEQAANTATQMDSSVYNDFQNSVSSEIPTGSFSGVNDIQGQTTNINNTGGSKTEINIQNININTQDDPDSIKTKLMEMFIELQEDITPKNVSRTVGGESGTTDTATGNNGTTNTGTQNGNQYSDSRNQNPT